MDQDQEDQQSEMASQDLPANQADQTGPLLKNSRSMAWARALTLDLEQLDQRESCVSTFVIILILNRERKVEPEIHDSTLNKSTFECQW